MATSVHEQISLSSTSIRSTISPATKKLSPRVSLSIPGKVGGGLPEFKGLKIQSPSKALLRSRSCGVSRKAGGGRIVCDAQGQGAAVIDVPTVNDATWKSLVLNADEPVLVEFWAPWCGPCRMIHPVIGELASEYEGKIKCFKLNTDESPSIATRYGVRSVPTTMIFRKGVKKDSVIGAVPKTTLSATIEKFL